MSRALSLDGVAMSWQGCKATRNTVVGSLIFSMGSGGMCTTNSHSLMGLTSSSSPRTCSMVNLRYDFDLQIDAPPVPKVPSLQAELEHAGDMMFEVSS
jgi:hypothetical protein